MWFVIVLIVFWYEVVVVGVDGCLWYRIGKVLVWGLNVCKFVLKVL